MGRPNSLGSGTHYGMLGHLAGQVPDELLDIAHDRLIHGDLAAIGRLLRFAGAAYGCTVPPAYARTVLDLVVAGGASEQDAVGLVFPRDPLPPYDFHAVHPDSSTLLVQGYGPVLDLVTGPERAAVEQLCDQVDLSISAAASRVRGLIGLWRSWRVPSGGASWPPVTRVVLAESDATVDPSAVRDELRAAVQAVGGLDSVVEVLASGARVPGYHQRARAASALLWAASGRQAPVLAPVFDSTDNHLPTFAPDHQRISDVGVRAQILAFLARGTQLLTTRNLFDDVVDPSARASVPMGVRTDGAWIWSDASAYYLDKYDLAPHAPLLDHMRSTNYLTGPVDSVAEHQALAVVLRPAEAS